MSDRKEVELLIASLAGAWCRRRQAENEKRQADAEYARRCRRLGISPTTEPYDPEEKDYR